MLKWQYRLTDCKYVNTQTISVTFKNKHHNFNESTLLPHYIDMNTSIKMRKSHLTNKPIKNLLLTYF